MNLDIVCGNFGLANIQHSAPLVAGLINNSYKIVLQNGGSYFLQKVNTSVFKNPLAIQKNYEKIQQHLLIESATPLPKLITTVSGDLLYANDNDVWRCFEFIKNTYSPTAVTTPEKAYEVANCFGSFTAVMQSLDSNCLETILPQFHDLSLRYQQFVTALQSAPEERIAEVKSLIQRVENFVFLVDVFTKINTDKRAFPLHIMHHDCKISNILFDKQTDAIRCPIDMDTTQPGLFFSDIGDMIRTIVSSTNEDNADIAGLQIRPDFFIAVTEGYMNAMSAFLTVEEKANLHYAGSLLIYMQAIRFLTDYLNGNVYYKITYPEQNKDRTANQLRLLDVLQEYIRNRK